MAENREERASIWTTTDAATGQKVLHVALDSYFQSPQLVYDGIVEVRKAIAQHIWDDHADKILANLDLKGMANLIAVYAAQQIAPKE
jgi:hypothetical protein